MSDFSKEVLYSGPAKSYAVGSNKFFPGRVYLITDRKLYEYLIGSPGFSEVSKAEEEKTESSEPEPKEVEPKVAEPVVEVAPADEAKPADEAAEKSEEPKKKIFRKVKKSKKGGRK